MYICPSPCTGEVKFVGLVLLNKATGFCQQGYECCLCKKRWQKPTMFAPEYAKTIKRHVDCLIA